MRDWMVYVETVARLLAFLHRQRARLGFVTRSRVAVVDDRGRLVGHGNHSADKASMWKVCSRVCVGTLAGNRVGRSVLART